jgi:hypothetical protein
MAATIHDFSLALQSLGNSSEAGQYRVAQHERQRRVNLLERRYAAVMLYGLWKMTSNYGESLFRWAASCLVVIVGFAVVYGAFGLIAQTGSAKSPLHGFDFLYFSVVTFSTLGYGDLHPVGFFGQATACLEVCAGYIMFGVLLSFVGNRFQRGIQ